MLDESARERRALFSRSPLGVRQCVPRALDLGPLALEVVVQSNVYAEFDFCTVDVER